MLAKAKHSVSAYQRETVPFLGLNRSDDTREGEFASQKNMSDRRYPYLAPRLPRAKETYTDPTALFAWDEKEIRVDGGKLYYDGEPLCNVTDGEKQFAVVNTKLVVWPDKLAVDLTNRTVGDLAAKAVNRSTATFTANTLSLPAKTKYASTTLRYKWVTGEVQPYLYTYSSVSWDEATGTWTKEDGKWTMPTASDGRMYIPNVTQNATTLSYTVGQPAYRFAGAAPSDAPSDEPHNDIGFYVVLDRNSFEFTATSSSCTVTASIYWSQQDNKVVTDLFSVGDVVSIGGTPSGYLDVDKATIKEIDSETNTITFDADVFPSGDAVKSGEVEEAYYIARYQADPSSDKYSKFVVTKKGAFGYTNFSMTKGQYAVLDVTAKKLYVYEKADGSYKLVDSYEVEPTTDNSSSSQGLYYLTMSALSYSKGSVTVERSVPDLDFICERENRLCGVSNKDDTIYISAWGDPTNFYAYSGDKGSYSVAVGSEGDFTGVCDYGNALLCWKERTLHKVLGDYPSNYQTATYRFSGVRAGAHKSLVNVNETLFFLGMDGVYAYTGNKPSLISRALGASVLKNGVGGTDGKAYYLSAKNGEVWELLSYDTHTGLWTRSDETQVVDFCRVGYAVKFLSGDSVYTIGSGDEAVEWEAVFVPMYETLEGGKQYNRLIFRVEVPKDGWMAADVRFDGGRWMQVGIVKGKNGPVHMPVPLRRCDKFQIRLRGKGDCAVLDMVREFRLRGDG